MTSSPSFVLFGTPEISAIVLRKLIAGGFVPSLVVVSPDRPSGRKRMIVKSPVKVVAEERNIPLWQPERLKVEDWEPRLRELEDAPYYAIVISYTKIIPKGIIDTLDGGFIGVHPSLLPRYRGPSPYLSALLEGEEKTGVTLYLMNEKMDEGPIIAKSEEPIESGETAESLMKKLGMLAGELLLETLPRYLRGEIVPKPQNRSQATYTRKFTSEDGFVSEEVLKRAIEGTSQTDSLTVHRKICALNPEPGAWTKGNDFLENLWNVKLSGKRVKLLEAEHSENRLRITRIQVEGRTPHPV